VSKNEFVLRFLFLQSTKTSQLYLLPNQSSAARAQAHATIWCKPFTINSQMPCKNAAFCPEFQLHLQLPSRASEIRRVEIQAQSLTGAGFG
jgi:hypothetical protein